MLLQSDPMTTLNYVILKHTSLIRKNTSCSTETVIPFKESLQWISCHFQSHQHLKGFLSQYYFKGPPIHLDVVSHMILLYFSFIEKFMQRPHVQIKGYIVFQKYLNVAPFTTFHNVIKTFYVWSWFLYSKNKIEIHKNTV